MCILSVHTLLKGVGYFDLSVLSLSVMGFQKNRSLDGGWVGGVRSIQVFFWIFGILLTLQSPLIPPMISHISCVVLQFVC